MSGEFVLRVAENVDIIYYKLKVEDYDKPGRPLDFIRSSTWRKEDREEWKRIFHHATKITK